jgi:hypothetical protein
MEEMSELVRTISAEQTQSLRLLRNLEALVNEDCAHLVIDQIQYRKDEHLCASTKCPWGESYKGSFQISNSHLITPA